MPPKKQITHTKQNNSLKTTVQSFNVPPSRCPGTTMEVVPMLLPCSFCKMPGADFECCICATLYCGVTCQLRDWQQHRMNNCIPRLLKATPVKVSPTFWMNQPTVQTNFLQPPMDYFSMPPPQVNVPMRSEKENVNKAQECNTNGKTHTQPKSGQTTQTELRFEKNLSKKQNAIHTSQLSIGLDLFNAKVEEKPVNTKRLTLQHAQFPDLGSKVRISSVADDKIFIYNAGNSHYLNFIKRSMEEARKTKQCLQVPPKEGNIVFAPIGGECYRAVVKSTKNAFAEVFFIDFGIYDLVDWSRCKEIANLLTKYAKCLVHAITIHHFAIFTPPMLHFLRNLVEAEEFELTRMVDTPNTNIKVVDLRHTQQLYFLSDKLRALPTILEQNIDKTKSQIPIKATQPTISEATHPDIYNPVLFEEFIKSTIPRRVLIDLIVLDESQLDVGIVITVIEESAKKRFADLMTECDQYGQNDPQPYELEKHDRACLVKYDGIWCRALRSEAVDSEGFYLVDVGIICRLVDQSDVRRYPAALSRQLYTSSCIVDNRNPLKDGDAHQSLELAGKIVSGMLHEDDDNSLHVKVAYH